MPLPSIAYRMNVYSSNLGNPCSSSANYGTDQDKASGYIKLHTLLKPYIIRRLKKVQKAGGTPSVPSIKAHFLRYVRKRGGGQCVGAQKSTLCGHVRKILFLLTPP